MGGRPKGWLRTHTTTLTLPVWFQKYIEMFGRLKVLPKLPRDEQRVWSEARTASIPATIEVIK
jgi:hypothetical protein